jgi:hypothetical protein
MRVESSLPMRTETTLPHDRAIQEENRRLYNTVQDLRGAIRVFCRVRPVGTTGDNNSGLCVDVGGEQDIAAYDPSKAMQVGGCQMNLSLFGL